jgi:tRNA-Thr(GGU) m(6)t(6)A37 methyltransferase TsaA
MPDDFISYKPVGVIRSGHTRPEATPIQPVFAPDCKGRVEIFPAFADGLRDIEQYSHIYLVYHLHRAPAVRLVTKPFLQDKAHDVFATRAPCRPNPIGLSIVKLVGREGDALLIEGVDILDGTPLLDIKPYSKRFDNIETQRNGWQDKVDDAEAARLGVRNYRKQGEEPHEHTDRFQP